jgi:hypothetical protein
MIESSGCQVDHNDNCHDLAQSFFRTLLLLFLTNSLCGDDPAPAKVDSDDDRFPIRDGEEDDTPLLLLKAALM